MSETMSAANTIERDGCTVEAAPGETLEGGEG
jgi:hypothetical protein